VRRCFPCLRLQVLCALEVLSPLHLYYNFRQVKVAGEVSALGERRLGWRFARGVMFVYSWRRERTTRPITLSHAQYWRLVTNFLYFGNWGIDFLFHMYFL
jgi:hypothetical protein